MNIWDINHEPFQGIEIGDLGLKNGCDGVDNGWMMFTNYWIPKDSLLNWYGDITEEGKYISPISSKNKWFAFMLGPLSGSW